MLNINFENKLKEFYLATSEFCKLLENISSVSKKDFLLNSQKLLSLIYLKASLIEKPGDFEEGEAEKFIQESDWNYIKEQVSLKLALSDNFIELTMPENYIPENIESISLSECYADIYQDLRDFSTSFEIGNQDAIIVSVYECIDNFEKFWGIRALEVLVSIHNQIYGEEIIDDEFTDNQDNAEKSNSIDTSNWLINKKFDNRS
jgi:hypothetical protein